MQFFETIIFVLFYVLPEDHLNCYLATKEEGNFALRGFGFASDWCICWPTLRDSFVKLFH